MEAAEESLGCGEAEEAERTRSSQHRAGRGVLEYTVMALDLKAKEGRKQCLGVFVY